MKLNLASGFKKLEGFVNIDINPSCNPDRILNLLRTPWPFQRDSVEEFNCTHWLEHIGEEFIQIMKEIHRVGTNGARVYIEVPHWQSIGAFQDPTHKRFFTESTFKYFDEWKYLYNLPHFKTKEIKVMEGNDGKYICFELEVVK